MHERLIPCQRHRCAPADQRPADTLVRRVRPRWLVLLATTVVIATVVVGLVVTVTLVHHTRGVVNAQPRPDGAAAATAAAPAAPDPVPAQPVSAMQLAALPEATTWGVIPNAPLDPAADRVPSGTLLSPTETVAVYSRPGGPPIAALPAQQLDGNRQPIGPTTVPVIATVPGWAQVLLPAKPNGATGWVDTDDPLISESTTPYLIRVDRNHYSLTLQRSGTPVGEWTVGVGMLRPLDGRTQSVTPIGRTFVIADIRLDQPTYSPIILPLGLHSPIFDSFGGGPGTVAIHTWTYSSTVYGTPSSHGCIRVPAAALAVLSSEVPIGTPVIID